MTADLVPSSGPVDLVADSLDGLVAVAFPRSRALRYQLAVDLARTASRYSESTLGTVPYHLAAFGRTQEQAARAFSMLEALRGQKAEYFVRGQQLKNVGRLRHVLECFTKACACNDPAAHCVTVIGDPFSYDGSSSGTISTFSTRKPLYYWPCSLMLTWATPKLQCPHPSTPEDQLQARAVESCCDLCPNFKPIIKPV
jgi:hypothetical protein